MYSGMQEGHPEEDEAQEAAERYQLAKDRYVPSAEPSAHPQLSPELNLRLTHSWSCIDGGKAHTSKPCPCRVCAQLQMFMPVWFRQCFPNRSSHYQEYHLSLGVAADG